MNYEQLGFRCGLEIHQQINTKYKLFCKCPNKKSEVFPITIKRRLRPVAGEMGTVDTAVAHEYLKNKQFIYKLNPGTSCLVEADEEPIHNISEEALEVALQVCLLLKAKIPDEIHIMRKTVIDGSCVSGFQRTALVGVDGYLDTSKGNVKITNISVEEDAAAIIDKKDDQTTFRLDRLSVPLIEIGTDTDIKDPEHAKEVAEKLGMIIRSTGKAMRGIGTIRQDVNVSIKGGSRVEIKGFQDLDAIPKVIDFEIRRQLEMISKNEKPKKEVRKAEKDFSTSFMRPLPGEHRLYPETDHPPIIITKDLLSKISLPETWEDKLARLGKMLPKDLANQVVRSEYLDTFEQFSKNDPVLVASTLTSTLKDMKRRGFATENLKEEHFDELFKKNLPKEAIMENLEKLCKNSDAKIESAAITDEVLINIVRDVIKRNPELAKERKVGALMGDVMKNVRGSVEGKIVLKILKEELSKYII